ncbi:zinc finger, CCHC-type containing protein [Tanacetum coccineum]
MRLFQFSLRNQANNWLERLPVGSITTWEDLTTRFLAQFFPSGRTAKLRNNILMFQQHHEESLSEAWTRGRLRKLRLDKAWAAIERLAQYKDEGWNDAFIPDEMSFNYENPDTGQILGIMERKVDILMKGAISLIGKSKSVFRLTTNEMYRPPSEPSQEFMEFSAEVARRLKERIKENENKPRKIEKITKYPDTKVLENSAKYDFLENLEKKTFPTPANLLCVRYARILLSSPSQPQKSTFGFKPEKRAN